MGRRSRSRSVERPKRKRSRSPNDRRRSRSREDKRRKDDRDRRDRVRDRSPDRHVERTRDWSPDRYTERARDRSRERDRRAGGARDVPPRAAQPAVITIDGEEDDTEMDEEERLMRQMMGFATFKSTKGKKVQEDVGEAHVVTKRKYRQYMNRRGGFNRPLDAVE